MEAEVRPPPYPPGQHMQRRPDRRIAFDGPARRIDDASGNTERAQSAIVHFRVGDLAHAVLLSASPLATTKIGSLTRRTGDGGLTISEHADNQLYIKNQTSATRAYALEIMALDGAALV